MSILDRVAVWVKAANVTLQSYETDNGTAAPENEEFGRIPESRESPSFRITAGHIRALADLVWNQQHAPSLADLRALLDVADDALDKETYEQTRKDNFDPPLDAEYQVTVGTIQKINAVFQALDAKLK